MKFESQLLKGVAPVVVLEMLSRGPMYGYELSQTIEKRSAEVLTLGKGTLYPLLYNLEAKSSSKASGKRPIPAASDATIRSPTKATSSLLGRRPRWSNWPKGSMRFWVGRFDWHCEFRCDGRSEYEAC